MKRFGKKAWWILGVCVVAIALVMGAVWFFGRYLPEKKAQKEWAQQVQAYRDAKIAQYRRENEAFRDYEVEVAFWGTA